jgi:uncharacterized protein (TIGR02266 family)
MPMDVDEQRGALRKPVVLKVRFRASTVEEFADRYSRDLSEGGMFVRSPGPLPPPGTVLLLECRLSDGALLINGTATVAWVRPQPGEEGPSGFGVRFDDLSQESRAVLAMILETSATAAPPPPPAPSAPSRAAGPTASVVAPAPLPTLIGEPAPPSPERLPPKAARPAWFRSHEFDDEEVEAAPQAPAPPPAETPPKGAEEPSVPTWFRSTSLLESTPPPAAAPSEEPAVATAAAPKAAAPAGEASVELKAPVTTDAAAPIAPLDRPRKTAPPQPAEAAPLRLPRPTPLVVAAPRDFPAEPPPRQTETRRPRRYWLRTAVVVVGLLACVAVGYAAFLLVVGDRSSELLHEIERQQAQPEATPAPAVPPAPTPAQGPPSSPPAAPAASPPTVVIPHGPPPPAEPPPPTTPAKEAAPAPHRVAAPKPRPPEPAPEKEKAHATRPVGEKTAEPSAETSRSRRGGGSANTDFQKRLRDLERMLKRK